MVISNDQNRALIQQRTDEIWRSFGNSLQAQFPSSMPTSPLPQMHLQIQKWLLIPTPTLCTHPQHNIFTIPEDYDPAKSSSTLSPNQQNATSKLAGYTQTLNSKEKGHG
jgi:hypothetical protein